jgi:hypothetical protein
MTASGAREENKDEPKINHPLFTNSLDGIRDIIEAYANAPSLLKELTLFNNSSSKFEILALAHHAAPFSRIEVCSRRAHARKETHLPNTLIEAAIKAIDEGDVTYRREEDVICEGMAEMLMKLYAEFYPQTYPEALQKVRHATPREEEKQRSDRERLNREAIKRVFDAYQRNDSNIIGETENFLHWARTTPVINRVHLIYLARMESTDKGEHLPKVNEGDSGGWYGLLGNQFYYRVIGGLQLDLSPRMKQVLIAGIYKFFNRSTIRLRFIDPDSAFFITPQGTNRVVGVSAFYGDFGFNERLMPNSCMFTYYEYLLQQPRFITPQAQPYLGCFCPIL